MSLQADLQEKRRHSDLCESKVAFQVAGRGSRRALAGAWWLCLIFWSGSIAGAGELSKEEISARDYGVGRIKLGMERSKFNLHYTPELGDQLVNQRTPGDYLRFGSKPIPEMETGSYVIRRGEDRSIVLGFQYGALVAISSVRENASLSAVRAVEEHQKKVLEVFGQDVYLRSGRNLTWRFPRVNRQVEYVIRDQKNEKQTVSVTVSFLQLHTSQ